MECKFEQVIPRIEKKLDKIDERTEKLLSMKQMIVGGAFTVAFLVSAIMAVLKLL